MYVTLVFSISYSYVPFISYLSLSKILLGHDDVIHALPTWHESSVINKHESSVINKLILFL